MLSIEDIHNAYPHSTNFDSEKIQHWIEVAEHALPAERVGDPRSHNAAKMLFVMHHMEKGARDLSAPHVVARMSLPGRRAATVRAPHPWSGTIYGEALIKSVRF
jgi:hypothetical protein